MKPTVYVETTVVSYLTARLSRDLIVAGHQHLTEEWWSTRRHAFELFSSQLVVQEASAGDPEMARERLNALEDVKLLEPTAEAVALAESLVANSALPGKAAADALHIAVAAVHGIAYLVTWNCTHLANAQLRPAIERTCRAAGFEPPILCTPEELMGD